MRPAAVPSYRYAERRCAPGLQQGTALYGRTILLYGSCSRRSRPHRWRPGRAFVTTEGDPRASGTVFSRVVPVSTIDRHVQNVSSQERRLLVELPVDDALSEVRCVWPVGTALPSAYTRTRPNPSQHNRKAAESFRSQASSSNL